MRRLLAVLLICLATLILLVACGGGGGGGGSTTPPPPAPATLRITTTTMPEAVAGETYTVTFAATGGTGAYTWSAGQNFPSWASINASTGVVTGTPTASGQVTMAVQVQDSGSPKQTASSSLTLSVNAKLAFTNTLPNGFTNVPYAHDLFFAGGKEPYTVAVTGTVPPGVTWAKIGSNPAVSFGGAPSTAGTYTFNVRVTDSANPAQVLEKSFTVNIAAQLAIVTANLKPGVVGRAYTDVPAIANGTAPYTWSAAQLPAGLSINAATGEIVGTPTAVGSSNVQLTVSDSSNPPQTATKSVGYTIYDILRIQPSATELTTHVGQPGSSVGGGASGGIPPLTWTVESGTVPPGFSFDAVAGSVSGTPTQAGNYNVGLAVRDSANPPQVAKQMFTINVLPSVPVIMGETALPNGNIGKAYRQQLYGASGTRPYQWSIASGALPPGLALSAAGLISGTPGTAGQYAFKARLTDASTPSQKTEKNFTISVLSVPLGRNDSIATATPLGNGTLSASLSPFADPVDAETGTPDSDYYRVVATAGSVVTIKVNALTSAMDPVLEMTDANGTRLQTCIDVGNDNPPADVPPDTTPAAYDDECLNDDIDLGNIINSELKLQVPGAQGTQATFYAHVLDWRGDARPDMGYGITASGIVEPLLITTPVPHATLGVPYQAVLNSSGGTGTVTWTISGALPPGLSFSGGAIISGTPTTTGTYTFTVHATDSDSPAQQVSREYELKVGESLQIVPAVLPEVQTGVPYQYAVELQGGTAPFTWMFTSSNWCCVTLDQVTGVFSGTPEITGSFTGTLTVSDAAGQTTTKEVSLNVVPGPLAITTTALAGGYVGWNYSSVLKVKGGTSPLTWSVVAGGLPPGLTLAPSTGAIAGVPTSAGTYNFRVRVQDSANPPTATEADLSITITANP